METTAATKRQLPLLTQTAPGRVPGAFFCEPGVELYVSLPTE